MGVTIHYAIGLQSGRAKRVLDRTQALAEEIRREQAVPLAIRRQSPTTLRIDMGQCETLTFDFNPYESYLKTDEHGRPVWSYGHSVLGRLFLPRVLAPEDVEHYRRYPEQRLLWSCAFCKTQFAASLAEHRWVAELIRSVASVAEYAHVYDEGAYYHTLDIEDAAKAIHANGLLINSITRTIAGNGAEIVKGGETTIKPIRKSDAAGTSNP